jgi:hypothetical protein
VSAARVIPEATYIEPLVGWRCWRVEKIETIADGGRFRLCAAGHLGVPKVWQPRAATVAHCSNWQSKHDAPHPKHECGVYAFREQVDAERKMIELIAYEREYARREDRHKDSVRRPRSNWACGRVLLWGRVVECELGWRAQYGYPYDVTLFGGPTTARSLATDYAVDVGREPIGVLEKMLRRYKDAVRDARQDATHDQWYQTSMYGIMDRSFLKPYHDAVMARLDELQVAVRSLEKEADDAS